MSLIIKTEMLALNIDLHLTAHGPQLHIIDNRVGVPHTYKYDLISCFREGNLVAPVIDNRYKDYAPFNMVVTHTPNDVEGLPSISRAERISINTSVRIISLVFIETASGAIAVSCGINWQDDADVGLEISYVAKVDRWLCTLRDRDGGCATMSAKTTLVESLVELTAKQIRETFGL